MTEVRYWIEPGSPLDQALDAAVGRIEGGTISVEQAEEIKRRDRADLRVAQRIALGARVTCRVAGIKTCPDDPQVRERWYGGIVGAPAPHASIGDFFDLAQQAEDRRS